MMIHKSITHEGIKILEEGKTSIVLNTNERIRYLIIVFTILLLVEEDFMIVTYQTSLSITGAPKIWNKKLSGFQYFKQNLEIFFFLKSFLFLSNIPVSMFLYWYSNRIQIKLKRYLVRVINPWHEALKCVIKSEKSNFHFIRWNDTRSSTSNLRRILKKENIWTRICPSQTDCIKLETRECPNSFTFRVEGKSTIKRLNQIFQVDHRFPYRGFLPVEEVTPNSFSAVYSFNTVTKVGSKPTKSIRTLDIEEGRLMCGCRIPQN
jgi:hypothetical protein